MNRRQTKFVYDTKGLNNCIGGNKRYVQKSTLGTGSYSTVYKCLDTLTGEIVAIKEQKITSETLQLISKEISIMRTATKSELSPLHEGSKYIVKLLDSFVDKKLNCHYTVMEYTDCGDLYRFITSENYYKNKNDRKQFASKVLYEIGQALVYLHGMGIAHRDVKPENILLFRKKTKNSRIFPRSKSKPERELDGKHEKTKKNISFNFGSKKFVLKNPKSKYVRQTTTSGVKNVDKKNFKNNNFINNNNIIVDTQHNYYCIDDDDDDDHSSDADIDDGKIQDEYEEERIICKLCDFGLSIFFDQGDKTKKSLGSIPYASPEIIAGAAHSFDSPDLWALTTCIYCVLFTAAPFVSGEFHTKSEAALQMRRISEIVYTDKTLIQNHEFKEFFDRIFVYECDRPKLCEVLKHNLQKFTSNPMIPASQSPGIFFTRQNKILLTHSRDIFSEINKCNKDSDKSVDELNCDSTKMKLIQDRMVSPRQFNTDDTNVNSSSSSNSSSSNSNNNNDSKKIIKKKIFSRSFYRRRSKKRLKNISKNSNNINNDDELDKSRKTNRSTGAIEDEKKFRENFILSMSWPRSLDYSHTKNAILKYVEPNNQGIFSPESDLQYSNRTIESYNESSLQTPESSDRSLNDTNSKPPTTLINNNNIIIKQKKKGSVIFTITYSDDNIYNITASDSEQNSSDDDDIDGICYISNNNNNIKPNNNSSCNSSSSKSNNNNEGDRKLCDYVDFFLSGGVMDSDCLKQVYLTSYHNSTSSNNLDKVSKEFLKRYGVNDNDTKQINNNNNEINFFVPKLDIENLRNQYDAYSRSEVREKVVSLIFPNQPKRNPHDIRNFHKIRRNLNDKYIPTSEPKRISKENSDKISNNEKLSSFDIKQKMKKKPKKKITKRKKKRKPRKKTKIKKK